MYSRTFEDLIQFDFLDTTNVPIGHKLITFHKLKYRSIMETIAINPELCYIAGGYFTKYLDRRPQTVDMYIIYLGEKDAPSDAELNALLNGKIKHSPWQPSDFSPAIKECTCKIKTWFLPSVNFDVKIRVTKKPANEILPSINYNPARISYSYAYNKFYFGLWFLTGGPRFAGSTDLKKRYEEKGFLSDKYLSYICKVEK